MNDVYSGLHNKDMFSETFKKSFNWCSSAHSKVFWDSLEHGYQTKPRLVSSSKANGSFPLKQKQLVVGSGA